MARLIEQKFRISVHLKKSKEEVFEPIAILTSTNLYINDEFLEELLILQGFGNNVEVEHIRNDENNDDNHGVVIYQTVHSKTPIKVIYNRT